MEWGQDRPDDMMGDADEDGRDGEDAEMMRSEAG